MSEKEKVRKKEISEHKKVLEKDIATSERVKKTGQNLVSDGKKICRAADKRKDQARKRLDFVDILEGTLIESDNNKWKIYEDVVEKDKKSHAIQVSFAADLEKQGTDISQMTTTAIASTTTSASGTTVMYTVFGDNPALSPELHSELEKTTKDSVDDIIKFIEKEISSILPGSEKKFENVIEEWSATASQKYKILLELRSVIFDQVIDSVAPNPNKPNRPPIPQNKKFQMAPWYPKSQNKKLRFCQAKFFILGFTDEMKLPLSVRSNIDSVSTDLKNHFDNLSNYGKDDGHDKEIEKVFTETIFSFASAIRLRNGHFKPTI